MKIEKSILRALQQSVLVLDNALRPVLANPAFFQLFELPSTDLEGSFVSKLINGEVCEPSLRSIIKAMIDNNSHKDDIEVTCTLSSGKQIYLLVNACRIYEEGQPEIILVELHNITKEKKAEMRIQELNNALKQHVATLDTVNKEIESYSHSVSHDLRTPLRFVNRIAHVLLHEPGMNLSGVAIKQVNMILESTTEMGKLIENLLLFSQVNREPILKRRVNMKKLFLESKNELEYMHEDHDSEIVIQDLISCQGDRNLLKEVTRNLLANALKFTREREKPRIQIGCRKTANETIYFVQDNGIGFDMRDSDSLFFPFQKIHTSLEYEGSGIGLALVKRIIEHHGGRIWAEGEVDKGAVFYFTLEK